MKNWLIILVAPIGILYLVKGMYGLIHALAHIQDSSFENSFTAAVLSFPHIYAISIYIFLLIVIVLIYKKKKDWFF